MGSASEDDNDPRTRNKSGPKRARGQDSARASSVEDEGSLRRDAWSHMPNTPKRGHDSDESDLPTQRVKAKSRNHRSAVTESSPDNKSSNPRPEPTTKETTSAHDPPARKPKRGTARPVKKPRYTSTPSAERKTPSRKPVFSSARTVPYGQRTPSPEGEDDDERPKRQSAKKESGFYYIQPFSA